MQWMLSRKTPLSKLLFLEPLLSVCPFQFPGKFLFHTLDCGDTHGIFSSNTRVSFCPGQRPLFNFASRNHYWNHLSNPPHWNWTKCPFFVHFPCGHVRFITSLFWSHWLCEGRQGSYIDRMVNLLSLAWGKDSKLNQATSSSLELYKVGGQGSK